MSPAKKHPKNRSHINLTANLFPISQETIGTPCLVRVGNTDYPGIVAHGFNSGLALLAFVNGLGLCGTTLEQKSLEDRTKNAYIFGKEGELNVFLTYDPVTYHQMSDWTEQSVCGQLKQHAEQFLGAGYDITKYLRY